jgi:muconolactone delta-isomerase
MQFLTLSRRRVDVFPPEFFTPELLAMEGRHVKELRAAGILKQIWLRGDLPGAAILWEAASEDEVRAAIGTLPIFKAGMLEIVTLAPLKPYPGMDAAK